MISIREAAQRGLTKYDWLQSHHTFSFGHYHDPKHMGFHSLRVINDDKIAPGKGFSEHAHNDMEILSYVLSGKMQHIDSLGSASIIHQGDIQLMSAGTGIAHSETNASTEEELHLLQIWIYPNHMNLTPKYQQQHFDAARYRNQLYLIASPDGRKGSLKIHQTVDIYAASITPNNLITYTIPPQHDVWVQVGVGEIIVEGVRLKTGDGAEISSEKQIQLIASENSEILLFDFV